MSNEIRKKCNVCGEIFCYTEEDIENNEKLRKEVISESKTNMFMAILGAFGGTPVTRLSTDNSIDRTNQKLDKIKDYSKCPKCNSTDISDLIPQK